MTHRHPSVILLLATLLVGLPVCARAATAPLDQAGALGGLCVQLGCGDGSLLVEMATEPRCLVQGFDSDPGKVASIRRLLQERRLYGQVTVEEWTTRALPYGANVVNLLIVSDGVTVPAEEVLRVLAPGGVVLQAGGGRWTRTVKGRPAGMDDWPQWRHGPDRNPVSKDTLVEVPERIQWLSFQGKQGKEMVTAGGRTYSLNEGLLRVRDAFNGLPLWSVKMGDKCRPAATQDGVLVSLGGKLTHLDGMTGKPLVTFAEAGAPSVILHLPGVGDDAGIVVSASDKDVTAFRLTGAKLLWRTTAVQPRGLSAADGALFLISGDTKGEAISTVQALEVLTGRPRWSRTDLGWARTCYRSSFGNGTVAFEAGRYALPKGLDPDKSAVTSVHFLSAADGKTIRDYDYKPAMRHDENPRAFFLGDQVVMHQAETKTQPTSLAFFRDLTSNPVVKPTVYERSFPLFCFPPVATERFFIYGSMGFTDWKTFEHHSNPITRGSCGRDSEGMLPANGLLYVFPKSCSCFSMLNGVAALAPAHKRPLEQAHPLIKGPGFGKPTATRTDAIGGWPAYRGDEFRSGSTAAAIPTTLKPLWERPVPAPTFRGPALEEWDEYPFATGPLTPPVVSDGLVVFAQPHTHRVFAVRADDGKPTWDFTANGRVDSAPTIHEGLCLFGTRTGWVYCLSASDGTLHWQLRVAPAEQRIVHCGQVESPWPTAGSVLVSRGTAYVSAGLHPLTDGGMRVSAIDPRTGAVKWQQIVTDMGYDDRTWRGRLGLEQDYSDLVVRDGDRIAMSRWLFDPATGKNEYLFQNAFYRLGKDGAYLQRGTWSYGYPMNRPRIRRPLQVGSGMTVYGINKGAAPDKFKWAPTDGAPARQELKLFRRDFKPGEQFNVQWVEQKNDTESRIGLFFPANRTAENSTWAAPYPGWVEAMVLAGDHLLLYAEGKLKLYAAADGKPVGEMPLAQPVWDGFAVAGGRLYLTTMDGRVLCLGR
jgi:outer membrane protein assembly factor BamB